MNCKILTLMFPCCDYLFLKFFIFQRRNHMSPITQENSDYFVKIWNDGNYFKEKVIKISNLFQISPKNQKLYSKVYVIPWNIMRSNNFFVFLWLENEDHGYWPMVQIAIKHLIFGVFKFPRWSRNYTLISLFC